MQLYVANRGALDDLWALLDDTLHQDDTFILQACRPFHHLLADLFRSNAEKCLNRVGTLAEVEEDHLVTLRTGGLHTSTDEDSLTVQVRVQSGDLCASPARAGLRLVQRLLSVELCSIVLRIAWDISCASDLQRLLTTSAAALCAASSACFAAFSAAFLAFSASFARFFSSLLEGPFSPSAALRHKSENQHSIGAKETHGGAGGGTSFGSVSAICVSELGEVDGSECRDRDEREGDKVCESRKLSKIISEILTLG